MYTGKYVLAIVKHIKSYRDFDKWRVLNSIGTENVEIGRDIYPGRSFIYDEHELIKRLFKK